MKVFARLVANWSLNYEHREQVLKANCLNCSRRQQKAFDVLKINAEMQKKSKKV